MKTSLNQWLRTFGVVATMSALASFGLIACQDDTSQHGQTGEEPGNENPEPGPTTNPCSDCTSSQTCWNNECVETSELCGGVKCEDGKVCVNSGCYAESDLCAGALCKPSETCMNDTCVLTSKICGENICDENQKCIDRACVDATTVCGNSVCNASQECLNNTCVDIDPCKNVNCETGKKCDQGECVDINPCEGVICDDGKSCLKGRCIDNGCIVDGQEMVCEEEGKVCKEGSCVDDGCANVTCESNETCVKGLCEETACMEVFCDEGKSCKGGDCIENACLDITCDAGKSCKGGECFWTACVENFIECQQGKICQEDGSCKFDSDPAIDSSFQDADFQTDEDGDQAHIVVKLNHQPSKNVIVKVAIGDDTEAIMLCDHPIPQEHPQVVDPEPCNPDEDPNCDPNGGDPNGGGCNPDEDPNCDPNGGDPNGGECNPEEDPNCEPSGGCNPDEDPNCEQPVELSCDVYFTPENWDQEQIITIQGIKDFIIDGSQDYQVTLTTESEDEEFNGLTATHDLENGDTDAAGIIVDMPNEMITTEAGGAASFFISLTAQPTCEDGIEPKDCYVTVGFMTNNGNEGNPEYNQYTITADKWNEPLEIKIIGKDDKIQDGNQTYKIYFEESESNDRNFVGLKGDPITVTNQDDDQAGIVVSPTEIVTSEDGTAAVLSVRLNSEPKTGTVTLKVEIDRKDEAFLNIDESGSLVFDKKNFDQAQQLVIVGLADHKIDKDQNYTVKVEIDEDAETADPIYKSIDPVIVSGVNKDVDKAGILVDADSYTVSESGTTATLSVRLNSMPSKTVNVNPSVADSTELALGSTSALQFDEEDWDQPQTITVKGVDDFIIDGNIKSNVVLSASSKDTYYSGLKQNVAFTTTDNDKAALVLTPPADNKLSIAENNQADTRVYKLRLSAEPTKDVSVTLASNDLTELKVSPTTLTFSSKNWSADQTFTLTSVDDNLTDGDQKAYVTLTSSSSDSNFKGLKTTTSTYTITDNEQPGIDFWVSNTRLIPDTSRTVYVRLKTKPVNNVTVTLSTADSGCANLAKTSFTFTPENYSTYQTTTVKSNSYTYVYKEVKLSSKSSAASGAYNGLTGPSVTMYVWALDNLNPKKFGYTGSYQSYTLYPGYYKLQVWGAAGGGTINQQSTPHAGLGGYAEAIVNIKTKTTAYINTGGRNASCVESATTTAPFNGGGKGHHYTYRTCSGVVVGSSCWFGSWTTHHEYGCAGGGASDIRLGSNAYDYRVITAGGGGGQAYKVSGSYYNGGYGGGTSGQTIGSAAGGTSYSGYSKGLGANATTQAGGGAGGGWYGGKVAGSAYNGGAGGSGYINSAANSYMSPYISYISGSTKAGNVSFPSISGGAETGHTTTGYAIISACKNSSCSN